MKLASWFGKDSRRGHGAQGTARELEQGVARGSWTAPPAVGRIGRGRPSAAGTPADREIAFSACGTPLAKGFGRPPNRVNSNSNSNFHFPVHARGDGNRLGDRGEGEAIVGVLSSWGRLRRSATSGKPAHSELASVATGPLSVIAGHSPRTSGSGSPTRLGRQQPRPQEKGNHHADLRSTRRLAEEDRDLGRRRARADRRRNDGSDLRAPLIGSGSRPGRWPSGSGTSSGTGAAGGPPRCPPCQGRAEGSEGARPRYPPLGANGADKAELIRARMAPWRPWSSDGTLAAAMFGPPQRHARLKARASRSK